MTLPEALELVAYWQEYPPTHILVGRLLNAKAPTRSRRKKKGAAAASDAPTREQLIQLAQAFKGGVVTK